MSKVLIDEANLTAIGNAIRAKNKQVIKYKPNEMAGAIKALALDNSITIQSNDAWKYVIDSTLEHQSITVKVSGELTGNNTTGYNGEVIFDPYITSNFGWLAGKITKTVDKTNHVITFSAEAATELSGVLQDGWTPVYVVDGNYYTTTTPDIIESLKPVSSSDNIENLLICGYYNIDESTNKLVATKDATDIGPVSQSGTKNYQNKYIKTINNDAFFSNAAITTIDIPNATTIGGMAFMRCESLKIVDISSATTIGDMAFYISPSSMQFTILNNTTPPSYNNESEPSEPMGKILVPKASINAYKAAWGSAYFDAIENYNITRENCTITVTKKNG